MPHSALASSILTSTRLSFSFISVFSKVEMLRDRVLFLFSVERVSNQIRVVSDWIQNDCDSARENGLGHFTCATPEKRRYPKFFPGLISQEEPRRTLQSPLAGPPPFRKVKELSFLMCF